MKPLTFAVVDPHIHQWEPRTTPRLVSPLVRALGRFPRALNRIARVAAPRPAREFVGVPDYVLSPYLPADYARDARGLGIGPVVHVQAGWAEHAVLGPVAETRWLDALPFSEAGLSLAAIVAEADPRSAFFERLLSEHAAASERFRGIRKVAARHGDAGVHAFEQQDGLYVDPQFLRGFERLAARGLSFDAWVYSSQLESVRALAERFAETRIVLDHLGTPVGVFGPIGSATGRTAAERAAIFGAWKDNLARLAECKNVFAKVSGLLMPVLGHGYHLYGVRPRAGQLAELLSPLIEHALDVFGPDRCMWASNFPMDKVSADLSAILDAYATVVSARGEQALRAVFRETALAFYRITDA